jgi:hypothetical protein
MMDPRKLEEIIKGITRRDTSAQAERTVTREELELRAKEEAEEEAKQEAQKAYDEAYADAYDGAYRRILDELLDEHGFSD